MKTEATQPIVEVELRRSREEVLEAAEKATPRLKPILEKVSEMLFSPEFRIYLLELEFGVSKDWLSRHFKRAVDTSPAAYVRNCRLETANRLLQRAQLPVWRVAEIVGYASPQAFSVAFQNWKRRNQIASDRLWDRRFRLESRLFEILCPQLSEWSDEKFFQLVREGFRLEPEILFRQLARKSQSEYQANQSQGLAIAKLALDVAKDHRGAPLRALHFAQELEALLANESRS